MEQQLDGLFAGLRRAHGVYHVSNKKSAKGKVQGRAQTVVQPVTAEKWRLHLDGKQGIGVVPINENNECLWGAIDVDDYQLSLEQVEENVREHSLPLLTLRSKSGGAHLYLFLSEPAAARDVRQCLSSYATILGFPKSEIFPKQEELADGDVGNWINMPYFNGKQTDRYCIYKGKALTLEAFVKLAKKSRQTIEECLKIEAPVAKGLEEAPPCLQFLATQGVPQGSRNNALFAFGVYARLRYPDDWESKVEEYNREHMEPPLVHGELTNVIGSLRRKNYSYPCKQSPIADVCNRPLCLTRKYGVGETDPDLNVDVSDLVRMETDPPTWYLSVNGRRVELTTQDLLRYNNFRERCMEQLSVLPRSIKQVKWEEWLSKLMQNKTDVEAPADAGIRGQFNILLNEFLTQRAFASKEEDILRGMPYVTDTGRILFRSSDLMKHLENYRFRHYSARKVYTTLKDYYNARHYARKIAGKSINVWSVPMPDTQTEEFEREDQDVPEF